MKYYRKRIFTDTYNREIQAIWQKLLQLEYRQRAREENEFDLQIDIKNIYRRFESYPMPNWEEDSDGYDVDR